LGHARRVGLAGEQTPQETIDTLLPTIRNDVVYESDRLRDENFPEFYRIRETAEPDANAPPLAAFFSLSLDKARAIAATEHLFVD
jgi:hypothetical protein